MSPYALVFVMALTAACTDSKTTLSYEYTSTQTPLPPQITPGSVRTSSSQYSPTPLSSTISSPSLSSPSAPSAPSTSASPGPFWANDSLVGVELECADPWKDCLAIGRLLHEPSGRCYPLGDTRPCGGNRSLVLDREAFQEGRLHSICYDSDSCAGYTMAYDGICYDASDIRDSLCNSSALIVRHPFGKWECLCPGSVCPENSPVIRQPSTPGRCKLPDFIEEEEGPYRVNCDLMVAKCLQRGLLPFQDECHEPLSNATCSEGEWLVLNETAAEAGILSAFCSPVQQCEGNALRLRADGRCHSEEELREGLCPGDALLYPPTGMVVCSLDSNAVTTVITVCEEKAFPLAPYPSIEGHRMTVLAVLVHTDSCVVMPTPGYCCPVKNDGTCAK